MSDKIVNPEFVDLPMEDGSVMWIRASEIRLVEGERDANWCTLHLFGGDSLPVPLHPDDVMDRYYGRTRRVFTKEKT